MFFFQYARNRNFKQKSSCSGQIFPVILVCLAGMLVAVIVTIGAGEGAKAKTYASNSADACSLATASCWAGSFNKLAGMNYELYRPPEIGNAVTFMGFSTDLDNIHEYYKEMYNFYNDFKTVEMRALYKIIYEEAGKYLTNEPPIGSATDHALYHTREAIDSVNQALTLVNNTPAVVNCTLWADPVGLADLEKQAADEVLKAAKCTGAFYVLTEYMKKVTDFFKKYQTENFSNAESFMQEAYSRAIKTGEYYALSNTGTSRLMSTSQGDNFGLWLGAGNFFNPSNPNSATYTWGLPGHQCSVSAAVVLPNISTYEILHAKWNYPQKHSPHAVAFGCAGILGTLFEDDPFNIAASKNLRKNMYDGSVVATLYTYLFTTLPLVGPAIHQETVDGKDCCDADHHVCNDNPDYCPTAPYPCCWVPSFHCETNECDGYHDNCSINDHAIPVHFDKARTMRADLIDHLTCVLNGLKLISGDLSSTGLVTIPMLKKWNDDIFKFVWPDPETGETVKTSAATSAEVAAYVDESQYSGMMVIKINSVALSSWQTTCTVTTSCEGGGSTTSASTAQFDGGDVGVKDGDNYYARIIGI